MRSMTGDFPKGNSASGSLFGRLECGFWLCGWWTLQPSNCHIRTLHPLRDGFDYTVNKIRGAIDGAVDFVYRSIPIVIQEVNWNDASWRPRAAAAAASGVAHPERGPLVTMEMGSDR